jgi:type I restriction enzyme, S subunit
MVEWKSSSLASLCLYINRGAAPSYVSEGGAVVLNQKCVRAQRVDYGPARRTDVGKRPVAADRWLQPYDILVNSTGVGTLGRVGQVLRLDEPTTVDSHITIVRPDPSKVDARYLGFAMRHLEHQIEALGEGSTGQTELSRARLAEFRLRVPPMNSQQAIAAVLAAIDDRLELRRQNNSTLEAIAQAIFRDWFIDFGPTRAKMAGGDAYLATELWSLFPNRLGDDGIPCGWQAAPLNSIIEFNPRERIAAGDLVAYLDMAALPTSGPSAAMPILREFKAGSRFRQGDTLLARITPCLENGKTAFVMGLADDEVGWGSTEFIVMRAIPPVPKVLSYLIARSPEFRQTAIGSMTGTSGRQRATTDAMMNYAVASPDTHDLWEAFGKIAEPLFERIAANDREHQTLSELRDLLLPKLMSGEISVRDRGPKDGGAR